MNSHWLLLDANYLAYRARYAMGNLSYEGSAIQVTYGFLQTVLHLMERFDTDKVAFCFDSAYSKRREIYPAYKANRKHNQPMTKQEELFEDDFRRQVVLLRKEYLPEIGFRNVFMQRGFEADDLLAAICITLFPIDSHNRSYDEDQEVTIIAADHDLYQCIRSHVTLYNPQMRTLTTLQRFRKETGLIPIQWTLIKSIAGCATDNVKGVPGVGEKIAIKYVLGKLKPATKAYKSIESKTGQEIKVRNWDLVYLPFPGIEPPTLQSDNIQVSGWQSVCKRLGFKSLKLRLPERGI